MRTSVSFNLTREEAERLKNLVKARKFESTSEYLRFLIAEDDVELISEDEILEIGKDAERLYKEGKLIRAKSLADFM